MRRYLWLTTIAFCFNCAKTSTADLLNGTPFDIYNITSLQINPAGELYASEYTKNLSTGVESLIQTKTTFSIVGENSFGSKKINFQTGQVLDLSSYRVFGSAIQIKIGSNGSFVDFFQLPFTSAPQAARTVAVSATLENEYTVEGRDNLRLLNPDTTLTNDYPAIRIRLIQRDKATGKSEKGYMWINHQYFIIRQNGSGDLNNRVVVIEPYQIK